MSRSRERPRRGASARARRGTRAAVLVAALAMLLGAGALRAPAAGADADPASDVLLAQGAFYPYQPPVEPALERAMERVLRSAAHAGFELKVAIIGSPEDLGAVPNFFGHPQPYAQFLDREISFNHVQPLLVVMAAGFGLVNAGPASALSHVAIDTRGRSYGLTRTAILAAVALARARHVPVATPAIPREGFAGAGPPALLVFGAPTALLILAGVAMRGTAKAQRVSARAGRRGAANARRSRVRRRRVGSMVVLAVLVLLGVGLARSGGHARSKPATAVALARGKREFRLRRALARTQQAGAEARTGESPEVRKLIALGKPIYCGGHSGHDVALTFDDGPGVYTRLALRKLRRAGMHATFFLVGRNLDLVPNAPREERALGMVGDHTMTHPVLPALPPAEAEWEIVRAQEEIARASGGPVFLFRPPYESMDETVASIVHAHQLLEILWDVDSQDSLEGDYEEIARKVIAGLRPGSIVLMHENHGQTIRALPYIFAAIHRRGLRTVSVPELLTEDPPSMAELDAGWSGCGLASAPVGD